MNKNVKAAIKKLGGNAEAFSGLSIVKSLEKIQMPEVFFDDDWADNYSTDYLESLCWKHWQLIQQDLPAFRKIVKSHVVKDRPSGCFWRDKPHQIVNLHKDYGFLDNVRLNSDDALPDTRFTDTCDECLKAIHDVTGDQKKIELIQILYVYGYPDTYYLCLQDPNTADPSVFSADHADSFGRVANHGPLSEFLSTYLTLDTVLEEMESLWMEIYTEEVKPVHGEDESASEPEQPVAAASIVDDDEYEEIDILDEDLENLLAAISNALPFEIKGRDEQRIAGEILRSVCELLDEKVGTELRSDVTRIVSGFYSDS